MKRFSELVLSLLILLSACAAAAETVPAMAAGTEALNDTALEEYFFHEVLPDSVNPFMRAAIREALTGVLFGHGGPFGAVIVRDNAIVGTGHNSVLSGNDPTAHGEISAIRDACRNLDTYDLSGCELYTTGEPCPMCLFACLWANIGKVYYGCTIGDNAQIGFRDKAFDDLSASRELLQDYLLCIDRDACLLLYEAYLKSSPQIY